MDLQRSGREIHNFLGDRTQHHLDSLTSPSPFKLVDRSRPRLSSAGGGPGDAILQEHRRSWWMSIHVPCLTPCCYNIQSKFNPNSILFYESFNQTSLTFIVEQSFIHTRSENSAIQGNCDPLSAQILSKRVRQQRISQHFVCTAPCAVRQARGKKCRKNWSDTSNTQGLLGLVAFWPNSKLRSALLASLRVGGNSKEA